MRPAIPLRTLLALLLCCVPALAFGSDPGPTQGAAPGRVVVLGFDGADHATTRRLIDAGQLPNLAALEQAGTFAPLVSTNPPESAAGWAALNTGTNPARNGVPSFFRRRFVGDVPMPTTGHIEIRSDVPIEDLAPDGLLGLVAGRGGAELSLMVGVGAFVVFFVLLAVLLRFHKGLAFVLSALMGGLGAYAPTLAREQVPRTIPTVFENRVTQEGFWDHAGRAGVDAIVLDAALSFGRPHVENTRVLGGLGLPDSRGAVNGDWFVYTTHDVYLRSAEDGGESAGSTRSGTVFALKGRDGLYKTVLQGPVDVVRRQALERELAAVGERLATPGLSWKEATPLREREAALNDELGRVHELRTQVPLEVQERPGGAKVRIAGQEQDLDEGAWSDWFSLEFPIGDLLQVRAITRARLESVEPLTLFVNSPELDPRSPVFYQPISAPSGFSAEAADWIGGPYETLGWSCMTNQMKDKAIDVQTFLDDIAFTMAWRERLLLAALERDDWRLLFSVYSVTDRVQHILYCHADPEHPLHDPEEAAREVTFFGRTMPLSECIDEVYRQMDARVGEVRRRLADDDLLLLCADHGFQSFRRQMDVNAWLAQEGYLVVDPGSRKGTQTLACVDWERTRAYSLGLGMVFLNLEGREPNGIVPVGEARALLEEIQQRFVAATDEGRSVGLDAEILWDLYPGPHETLEYECADLMLGFDAHYRAAWSTVGGSMSVAVDDAGVAGPGRVYSDNKNPWCGDHAGNSRHLVTGIFFSSRPVVVPEGGLSVLHLAPTVLAALGVPRPEHFELQPLELR